MDPHRSVFRSQWPASSYAPPRFPSPVYGTSPIAYSPVGATIPIGVSFSSRSLASSRDLPPSPTYSSRRGRYEDAFASTSYTNTTSSSGRYGHSPSTRGVDPYDISIGGSSTSCSHSSKLSRRIDSFLKTSEQTIERVSRRRGSGSSWVTGPDSPDLSLSLSGRAYRSTSAASIAVKAKKHLSALNDSANRVTGAGCSTSDSLDDLDSDSDEGLNEVSDDTSADLSKLVTDGAGGSSSSSSGPSGPAPASHKPKPMLDDLSSDSDDDEFFDVVPLGHRSYEGNSPLKVPDSKASLQVAHENSTQPPSDTQVASPGMGNVFGGNTTVVAAASVSSIAAVDVASSAASSVASATCISSSTVTSVASDINTTTSVSSANIVGSSINSCADSVPSAVTSNASVATTSSATVTSSTNSIKASTVTSSSNITSVAAPSSIVSTTESIVTSTTSSTATASVRSSHTVSTTVSLPSTVQSNTSLASTVSSVTSCSTVPETKLSSINLESETVPTTFTTTVVNGPTSAVSNTSMASPGTSLLSTSPKVVTPLGDGPPTPSPSHKKYQAPLPPGTLSRQASSASIVRTSGAAEVPLSRQLSSASLARHSGNYGEDGKKCQRAPSFKKYPAPSPPGLARGNSSASINSGTDATKSLLPNDTNHKRQNSDDSTIQLTNGDVHLNTSSNKASNGPTADLPGPDTPVSNSTKATNGHVEDILNAFQRGASESMQQLKASAANTKNDITNSTSEKSKSLSNGSSLDQSSSRDVSVDSSATDDDKSKRASRDPGGKKSSRKLGSIASKFESNSQSSGEIKNTPSSPTDVKTRKFNVKAPPKNKLGSLASKFEGSDSTSGKDAKTAALKLQSPYTDLVHLIPPSAPPPVVQRKSIGGINVSKFGGTGKFPTQQQLRKGSKTGSEEGEPQSSEKLKGSSLGSEADTTSGVEDAKVKEAEVSIVKSQTDEILPADSEGDKPKNKPKEISELTNGSVTSTEGSESLSTEPKVGTQLSDSGKECLSSKDSVQKTDSPELAGEPSVLPPNSTPVELPNGVSSSLGDSSTISSASSVVSTPKISCASTVTSLSLTSAVSEVITSTESAKSTISAVTETSSSSVTPSSVSVSTPDPATSVALSSSVPASTASNVPSTTNADTSSATVEGKLILYPAVSSVSASASKTDEPGSEGTSIASTGARSKLSKISTLSSVGTVSNDDKLSKKDDNFGENDEFHSPRLELSSSYPKSGFNFIPSEKDSPDVLSPSISLPSASIFTRASSVSPSINISRAGENGLNACLSEDIFSRARSLTPLESTGERRSLRPKSKYLQSGSPSSPLDLGRHESALEKYRRRKEMRNNAAKAKLEALTKQTKDISLSDSTLAGESLPPVRNSEKSSGSENSKFKLDLSSIKDFLKKTEEEISKLPRYIREPWTVTEFLSGSKNSSSSTASSTTDTTATSTSAPMETAPSPDDPEVTNAQHRRSSEGDVEIYVDARDRIDTSQLDTLMPLPDPKSLERRCRSVTPSRVIANTEKILSETDRLLKKSRSGNSLRKSYSRSMCAANVERLAEVVADLAEEHSTAQLAGERLEAEQADRMRLEKELDTAQGDMRELSIARERLEHEKSVLRVEMLQHASSLNNGDINDADDASSASLYKRKYEWSQREVETLKQQLRQHQQDEAEQTALLKKQLEKKINDAREETEEQRQVAGQLKKRTQRLQAEMNDLKILLEEQSARNSLLEKKQRKFDSELSAGQDELRLERLNKEKVMRERDAHLAEKYAVDQELSTLKLELELKDERVAALTRQLDELSVAGHGDHELTQLRKAKHDLETKLKDQEEELDELAGQVQMLEAARTRLEMSHEQMRKEHKKEVQQREEEVEEVRIAAQKKVKALEAQVEAEHEERTQLVRDKHEMERRLLEVMDRSSAAPDDDTVHRLKKDLRKTKALLKDTQTMLEKSQSEGPNKLIIRQLKTQLEDCEFAKTAALKARQSADADLAEMQSALDDSQRSRKEAEDRASRLLKEKSELQTQLEENEELHAETLKKYKSTVSQISVDQITLSEQSQRIAELEQEKQLLSERLLELNSKVEVLEGETANIHTQRMLQMKVKELESKLELELATKKRIESQVTRLKEQLERVSGECDMLKVKESQGVEQSRKLSRQLRQAKEEAALFEQRNTELNSKKQELEKQMEIMESEISTLKSDLKLAFKRIEDLQMALQGDISDSDSDLSDRGEDLISPGSDAMAMIEEAREDDQNSESFA